MLFHILIVSFLCIYILQNLLLIRETTGPSIVNKEGERQGGAVGSLVPGRVLARSRCPRALARHQGSRTHRQCLGIHGRGRRGQGPQRCTRASSPHFCPHIELGGLSLAAWRSGNTTALPGLLLELWSSARGRVPRGHLVMSGDRGGCHDWGGSSSGWGPGILPNTPQCTGRPTTEHDPAPRAEKQSQAGSGERLQWGALPCSDTVPGRADPVGLVRIYEEQTMSVTKLLLLKTLSHPP